MSLIEKLKTDHEMGTAKIEQNNYNVYAIGASRQITAFPLLGLVGKEKIATSQLNHVNMTFSLKLLRCPMFTLGHEDHILRP